MNSNKKWKPGPLIIMRPVRSIGRFFMFLSKEDKERAKDVARSASRAPRHVLESEYKRLEAASRGRQETIES